MTTPDATSAHNFINSSMMCRRERFALRVMKVFSLERQDQLVYFVVKRHARRRKRKKKKQSLFDFFWWKKRKDIRSNAESSFVRSAGEAEHFVIDLQIPERRMQVRMKINWRADDSGGKHGSGDTNCWT